MTFYLNAFITQRILGRINFRFARMDYLVMLEKQEVPTSRIAQFSTVIVTIILITSATAGAVPSGAKKTAAESEDGVEVPSKESTGEMQNKSSQNPGHEERITAKSDDKNITKSSREDLIQPSDPNELSPSDGYVNDVRNKIDNKPATLEYKERGGGLNNEAGETTIIKSSEQTSRSTGVSVTRAPGVDIYIYRFSTDHYGGAVLRYGVVVDSEERNDDSPAVYHTQGVSVAPEREIVDTTGSNTVAESPSNEYTTEYKAQYDNTSDPARSPEEEAYVLAETKGEFFVADDFDGKYGIQCDRFDCDYYAADRFIIDTLSPLSCNDPKSVVDNEVTPGECEVIDRRRPQISPNNPPDDPEYNVNEYRCCLYKNGVAYLYYYDIETDENDDGPSVNGYAGGVILPTNDAYRDTGTKVNVNDGRNNYGVFIHQETEKSIDSNSRITIWYAGYKRSIGTKED